MRARYNFRLGPAGCVTRLLTLIKPFWAICLLRLAPQDLPVSHLLLGVTLTVNLVCRTAVATVHFPFNSAVLVALANLVVVFLIVVALLQQAGKSQRIVQTVTALAGAGILLNIIALPITVAIVGARARGADSAGAELLLLGLRCWNWAIVAHVMRHALSVRFATGAAIAFMLIVVTYLVLSAMFPNPALDSTNVAGQPTLAPGEDPLR